MDAPRSHFDPRVRLELADIADALKSIAERGKTPRQNPIALIVVGVIIGVAASVLTMLVLKGRENAAFMPAPAQAAPQAEAAPTLAAPSVSRGRSGR